MLTSLRFSRFFAAHRHAFALSIAAVTLAFAYQLRHLEVYTRFADLLPTDHPFIDTYRDYRDAFGSANTVSVAVVARTGDIYQQDVLRAVERVTELLDSSIVSPDVHARPASHYATAQGILRQWVHRLAAGFDWFTGGSSETGYTGVDHNTVQSLSHRTARDLRIDRHGTLRAEPLFSETPGGALDVDSVRDRIRRNPALFGVLVSLDERAAQVRASFVESRVDYAALFKHLQAMKQEVEASYPVRIYITGQPMLFGWTYAFAGELLLIFTISIAVTVGLLWAYFRRLYGVFLPLVGAVANTIWGLGFAAWWGFALDPLVLVVPMLITARAVSHSVQFVERFYEEYEARGDKEAACVFSMAELLAPGTLAILTDAAGLAVLAVTTIPLIQNLGILAAFWALSIFPTEMLLNRLLILYLPPPRRRTHGIPAALRGLVRIAAAAGRTRPRAIGVVALFAVVTGVMASRIPGLVVGESRPGSAVLYPDSEYNVAAGEIARRFYGVEDLLIVAESAAEGRTLAPDACKRIEALQLALAAEGAGGSVSFVDLLHQVGRTYHYNDPRWTICPQTTDEAQSLAYLLEAVSPAAGYLDPYRIHDYRSLSVRAFYFDHRAETVERAIGVARAFADAGRLAGSLEVRLRAPGEATSAGTLGSGWWGRFLPDRASELEVRRRSADGAWKTLATAEGSPDSNVLSRWEDAEAGIAAEVRGAGWWAAPELWIRAGPDAGWQHVPERVWSPDGLHFRLAAGTIGLAAATSEAIARDHVNELLLAFGASFVLIALTYRSFAVGVLLIASLGTAAVATFGLQAGLGVGLDVHTLPVQAIGIGVGVDYAIYVVDRIRREFARGLDRAAAIERALHTTGVAVAFTASTLIAAIAFWIPLSSLRFAGEMSLLLCTLMVFNAISATVLVPALMRLAPERVWAIRSKA